MTDNFFSLLIPDLNFFILQSLSLILIAALLPGLKISGFFGPFLSIILVSWFNNYYWDSRLFYAIPESFNFDWLLLVLANSLILWIIIKLAPGIEIEGFFTPIITSLLLTLSSILVHTYAQNLDWSGMASAVTSAVLAVKQYFSQTLSLIL